MSLGEYLRDVSLKQVGEFATECHSVLHEGRALIKERDKQKHETSIEFIKYRFYFQTQLKQSTTVKSLRINPFLFFKSFSFMLSVSIICSTFFVIDSLPCCAIEDSHFRGSDSKACSL